MPEFKTLMSCHGGLKASVMIEGRTAACAGMERSGQFGAIREGFVGEGASLEGGACGDGPGSIGASGDSFEAHAKALRDRRAGS